MSNFRIYNDALCPDLWDSAQHLNPKIRANLLQMAYDFYEKTELPAPIIDVYLMGSGANYNWTPDSDVDVHVIIDYTKLQIPPEPAFKTVKTAGAQWNLEHNVLIKGHKVEMNIQNYAEQKPYVTGIYSLIKDQWVRKPSKTSFQLDKQVLKAQYEAMKTYVKNTVASRNRDQMKAAKKYLDTYRQYGLDTNGELSYENIIYKMLRARGLIKLLKDSITQVYDQEMTVDEVGERDVKQTLPDINPKDSPEFGNPQFDRSILTKHDNTSGFDLTRLTLDELKALREQTRRVYLASTKGEDQWRQVYKNDFKLYSDEIKRRLGYINAPITKSPMMSNEGVGAGVPEDDRLKIDNTDGSVRRWQVRSKDAPKTPKFTGEEVIAIPKFDNSEKVNEDVNHTAMATNSIKQCPDSRINLFPPEIVKTCPDIQNIISIAERILDNKSLTHPFFEEYYIEDLIGDIINSQYNDLPSDKISYIVQDLVLWLAKDYDIRHNGKRIG